VLSWASANGLGRGVRSESRRKEVTQETDDGNVRTRAFVILWLGTAYFNAPVF